MDPKPPLRKLFAAARRCPSCLGPLYRPRLALATTASFSTTAHRSNSDSDSSDNQQRQHIASAPSPAGARPRWETTPSGMQLPFAVRARRRNGSGSGGGDDGGWACNASPARLDAMYRRLLGEPRGDALLSDEVKWLAVTHKSFDQGRRGFNDRLSYLGKRIVELQTSTALVAASKSPLQHPQHGHDAFGREPFQHPQLAGLSNLSDVVKAEVLSKARLAQLAAKYGITGVLRWKPKKVDNLAGSGIELVLSQALYAIVGAISLEQGGEVANKVAREKILQPLGIVS